MNHRELYGPSLEHPDYYDWQDDEDGTPEPENPPTADIISKPVAFSFVLFLLATSLLGT